MNRRSLIVRVVPALVCALLVMGSLAHCQDGNSVGPGDRVGFSLDQTVRLGAASLAKDVYRLGPGDVLAVNVQGRSVSNYLAKPESADKADPTLVTIGPTDEIYLPLIGTIDSTGKTVVELESEVRSRLAKYFKHFTVNLSLSVPRPLYAWISGEVSNAGMQPLPAVATASFFAAKSEIRSTGSVRRIECIHEGKKQIIDLYRMMVIGDIDADINLTPGDRLYVPPMTKYVEARGEVTRGGRFEMVTFSGVTETFRVRDLLDLTIGNTPSAALDKSFIERIGPDGKKIAINVNLSQQAGSSGLDIELQSGDVLMVPSVSAFQPMIRLLGEFKGDGVYQRALPADTQTGKKAEIQNKSGIYFLKQGQSVGDVITATGGVTPQADMKRARIERQEAGVLKSIQVDLNRLLVKGDRIVDVPLENGDTLVLPALADKVHVFGEVRTPGSMDYSPSRHLIDYLGDAGGPTERSKLSDVRIVKGTADAPKITRVDVNSAIIGKSASSNPTLEAGDIVFVPSKFIGGWREGVQLIFTSLSLGSLLRSF